jgi:pescadillo protein
MAEEKDEEDVDSEDDGSEDEQPLIDSGDDDDNDDDDDEDKEEGGNDKHDDAVAARKDEEYKDFMRDGISSAEIAGVSSQLEDGEEAAGGALGMDAEDEASVCGALFKGLVFFLAREVPREPLLLVIR